MIYSHSGLSCFSICPRQFHHRYILKDVPKVETEAMRIGTKVHKELEDYVRDGTELPEDLTRSLGALVPFVLSLREEEDVSVELELAIDMDGKPVDFHAADAWFRGKADVVIRDGKYAVLADWKTGKVREDPTELGRHAFLVRARFSEVEVITGFYVWLKEGSVGNVYKLSPESALRQARMLVSRIERSSFPPTPGPLCPWCNVTSCEYWRER